VKTNSEGPSTIGMLFCRGAMLHAQGREQGFILKQNDIVLQLAQVCPIDMH